MTEISPRLDLKYDENKISLKFKRLNKMFNIIRGQILWPRDWGEIFIHFSYKFGNCVLPVLL